jgi:hypothetical protein
LSRAHDKRRERRGGLLHWAASYAERMSVAYVWAW